MMNNCNTVSTMEQIEGADGKSSEKILKELKYSRNYEGLQGALEMSIKGWE